MTLRKNALLHPLRRPINARLLASLLLVFQLLSMALIAAHTIGHADSAHVGISAEDSREAQSGTAGFARLFGHAAGADCDDWNAAFAPDRDRSSTQPEGLALLPSVGEFAFPPDAALQASPFPNFLARGPPHRLSTT